jgi:hypothetical protein
VPAGIFIPAGFWWEKHDGARRSYLAARIMLGDAISFKLDLVDGSKTTSDNATFFHGTTPVYARSRDERNPRRFVNFRGVECKTPVGMGPAGVRWEKER